MNYKLEFQVGIADPRLLRMKRELQTQFEAWKLRYRLGLTKEILHTEIMKWTLEMGYLPKGQKDLERTIGFSSTPPVLKPWTPSRVSNPYASLPLPPIPASSAVVTPVAVIAPVAEEALPKPGPPLLKVSFVADSLETAFTHCPGCGRPRVRGEQKVHSHSIVPASMWPVIVIEAMKALPVKPAIKEVPATAVRPKIPAIPERPKIDPALFGEVEKQIVGEIAKIGLATSGAGADDECSSLCLDCEMLHSNMSLMQRYEASLLEPDLDKKLRLVGLQFGATRLSGPHDPPPVELKGKLVQYTRNQLARVAARMEHELCYDLPRHFTKQTTRLGTGKQLVGEALENRVRELRESGKLTDDTPSADKLRLTRDGTGEQLQGKALEDRIKEMYESGQRTAFSPLLERLILDIGTFMAEIKKQGLAVCQRELPNDFSSYSTQYTLGL